MYVQYRLFHSFCLNVFFRCLFFLDFLKVFVVETDDMWWFFLYRVCKSLCAETENSMKEKKLTKRVCKDEKTRVNILYFFFAL